MTALREESKPLVLALVKGFLADMRANANKLRDLNESRGEPFPTFESAPKEGT